MRRGKRGRVAPGCPIRPQPESGGRISERGAEFNGGLAGPVERGLWAENALHGRKCQAARDRRNLAQSRRPIQDAVLGPAQIGDAHGEPDAEADQHHGERPAAMLIRMRWRIIVGLALRPLVAARGLRRRAPSAHLLRRAASGGSRRGARPKLETTWSPSSVVMDCSLVITHVPAGLHLYLSRRCISHTAQSLKHGRKHGSIASGSCPRSDPNAWVVRPAWAAGPSGRIRRSAACW